MKNQFLKLRTGIFSALLVLNFAWSNAQTNVFDAIISQSADHTYLTAAINQQGLAGALQNPNAALTVFAPTNAAFENLATALGTDISGLLALPNLTDVLLYHVLGSTAQSGDLSNGMLVTPLNQENTIKVSITANGIFANQAQVTAGDLNADNGVVHVINEVLIPVETVVDLALNNPGFDILLTAVIQEGLVPTLSNPLGNFTVLAPTDLAFTTLMDALNINAEQLLALDNLTDILLYHVFGSQIAANDLTNGLLAAPLSSTNTLKVTVKNSGEIFFNQAQVVLGDVLAANGIVHVLSDVLLPVETVVDVAINNGFTYLAAALIQEELLPVLTNPLGSFTVFAPTNAAFDALAAQLNTNIEGLLALNNLSDVLLYHVTPGTLAAADLSNGPITMVSGEQAVISTSPSVTINQANVITANVSAFNGIVHVIDAVILPNTGSANLTSLNKPQISVYPNPASQFVSFTGIDQATIKVVDLKGTEVLTANYSSSPLNISALNEGVYFIYINNEQNQHVVRLVIQ